MSIDYYKVLGIEKDATKKQVKKAYRTLAKEYHPDRNPDKDAESKFKDISEAHQILIDPKKREHYDKFGSDLKNEFPTSDRGFQDFYNFYRRRESKPRGSNIQIILKLTLEEIALGFQKNIKLEKWVSCKKCNSIGGDSTDTIECGHCHGMGQRPQSRQGLFGQFVTMGMCPQCQGEGKLFKNYCKSCEGNGRVRAEEIISLNIPSGICSDNYITLQNNGNVGYRGGAPGNLIIGIEELEHNHFTRHGNDILFNLTLNFSQVALGTEIEVPMLNGKSKLKIRPGTQTNTVLKMINKGFPYLNETRKGDQLVKITVSTPTNLSSDEKELFEKLK